jgi:predicted DNA-binding transcriptional regulator YafY
VTALHAFIVPLTNAGPTVNAGTLSSIAGACRDCEKLHFKYRSREGVGTAREVEPHRLIHTGRRWYLAAWDTGRKNWRTFRVDRIEAKVSAGARFTPRDPPDGDFAAYVSRSVAWTPYPYRARVTLHASAAMAAERVPPGAGILEAIDERTCVLSLGACSLDTISLYLALIGFDFEVHEPPELIERVRWLAERFRNALKPA